MKASRYLTAFTVLTLSLAATSLLAPRRPLRNALNDGGDSTTSPEAPLPYRTVSQQQSVQSRDSLGVALLKQADSLHKTGQYQQAMQAYERAAELLPQIADWIAVAAALSSAHLGDTAAVSRYLESIADTRVRDFGWQARAFVLAQAGDTQRSLELATRVALEGDTRARGAAWYHIAALQRTLGNNAAERAALVKAIEAAPVGGTGLNAARELLRQVNPSNSERLLIGRTFIRNGSINDGIDQLRKVLAATASAADKDELRYEMARVLFNAGQYGEAETLLRPVDPRHRRGAEARFLLARAKYRQGREAEGRRTFRSVVTDFPSSPLATRALYFLADLEHDDGDLDNASALFRQVLAQPRTSETALALMRRGGIAFARGQYTEAAQIFEDYRTRFPSGEQHHQATFWSAQAYMRAGQTNLARERLAALRAASPLSYYGVHAAEQLDEPIALEKMPSGPTPNDSIAATLAEGATRYELLRAVDWSDAAALELNRLKERAGESRAALYALAEEMIKRDLAHISITLGRDLLRSGDGWNTRLLRIMYPLPYQSLIVGEARNAGLDPYFVAALIRQESSFNRKAVSGAGAVGLMQVLPSTGRALARQQNLGPITPETLTDPAINVKLGTRFLADLVSTYGNRLDAVLAAYNAGPSRMSRWRNFPEYTTPVLFIERIPFEETRDYVKIVRLNAAIYRALYASEPLSGLAN